MITLGTDPSLFYYPVGALILKRLKMPPWLATGLFSLGVNLPILLLCAFKGSLINQGQRQGLIFDYGWWTLQISFSATFYAYLWLPSGLHGVLSGLLSNNVIEAPLGKRVNDTFGSFLQRFSVDLKCFAVPLGSFIMSIAYVLLAMLPKQERLAAKTWQGASPFIFWYTICVWILIYGIGILAFFRVSISLVWLNKIFKRFRIRVMVLHPDQAGGLSPLGKFSTALGYVIMVYGFANIMATVSTAHKLGKPLFSQALGGSDSFPNWLAYLILAPVVFFSPLAVAHSAMKDAKTDFLKALAMRFDREVSKVHSILSDESASLKNSTGEIEELQKMHAVFARFPIWPFNTGNLSDLLRPSFCLHSCLLFRLSSERS